MPCLAAEGLLCQGALGGRCALDILILAGIGIVSFGLAYVGSVVGLVLGHLRLMLLIFWLGSPVAGAATNLAVSGLTAISGTYRHAREKRVDWHLFLLMGIPSGIGAWFGVYLGATLDPSWSKAVIGLFLTGAGFSLLQGENQKKAVVELSRRVHLLVEGILAVGLGVLAGIIGMMMGSLRLPAMIRVLRIPPHIAVGSNMAISCFTAAVGTTAALINHPPDWKALAVIAPFTMIGSYFGAKMTGKLKPETIKKLVGWVIFVSGVAMALDGGWELVR